MLMFGGFLYVSVTMLKLYPHSGKPRMAASELEDSIIEYTPNTLVHAHTHTCLCTHSVHTHEHRYTHVHTHMQLICLLPPLKSHLIRSGLA